MRPRETLSRAAQLARLGRGLREFLAEPIDVAGAAGRLRHRFETRERRFLEVARRLVYEHPPSPYRAMLAAAGCELGDLEASVRHHGLEGALKELRAAGVYVTLDELKARAPIVRHGLCLETREAHFDSPLLLGRGLPGATSGSRSPRARVHYDWRGLSEEADNQVVLDAIHGVDRVPLALWFPAPPGVGGMRNAILSAKSGRPPQRWFSHTSYGAHLGAVASRVATRHLLFLCRRAGARIPAPERVPLGEAGTVAAWLGSGGPRVIRTMTSSAVRVAEAAGASGISLQGRTALIGGEPMTPERRRFLEGAKLRVVNRYATAEAGIAGAACGREWRPEALHLYGDRVAAVESEDGLLLTSLSPYGGKVLLNASLGDRGVLEDRDCDCSLGRIGMRTWITDLGSDERVTVEGMTLLLADLHSAVGRALSDFGGGPDRHQIYRLREPGRGSRLRILVSPALGADPRALQARIYEELGRDGQSSRMISEIWSQADALEVVAEEPRVSEGFKLLPVAAER